MPKKVLLADDSVTIRKVVELTFAETDIRVEAVGSGAEALERLQVTVPDLVLADVVMPGPDGYELCRRVKDSEEPVPVLLLAGTFEPFDAERARTCGADGHLVKPFESRVLLERVERLLAARQAATDSLREEEIEEAFEALDGDLPEPGAFPDDAAAETAAVPVVEDEGPDVVAEPEEAPVVPGPEAVEEPPIATEPEETPPVPEAVPAPTPTLGEGEIEEIVRKVLDRLSDRVVREIAWDVVPDLAEIAVRERLRELEREDENRN